MRSRIRRPSAGPEVQAQATKRIPAFAGMTGTCVQFRKRRVGMLEVKADALEASFEALERQDEDVAQLREEMAQLKGRIDAQAVAGARPALSGAKAAGSPFVDAYLR